MIGEAVRSFDPADPVDLLLARSRGSVLRIPGPGEEGCDAWEHIPTRTKRRLVAAGLIGKGRGESCDQLLQAFHDGRIGGAEFADMGANEFVTWYVEQATTGLDLRLARRQGVVPWHESTEPEPEWWADSVTGEAWEAWADQLAAEHDAELAGLVEYVDTTPEPEPAEGTVCPGEVPGWAREWSDRLVYGPKRELLRALCEWRWHGGPRPMVPACEWAAKLVIKFEKRARVVAR